MTPQEFISKWQGVELRERQFAQEHFCDLCRLAGHPTPAELDKKGTEFCFEKGAKKRGGEDGWADVWKRGAFAWEYKGKRSFLKNALQQLEQYQSDLENPPLLVAADSKVLEVHTRFTNTVSEKHVIDLTNIGHPNLLAQLRNIFHNPEAFRPKSVRDDVTKEAASQIGALAQYLKNVGEDPMKVAHFLVQCVFCFFAEDIGLLPDRLFQKIHENAGTSIDRYVKAVVNLFTAMRSGGDLMALQIRHFNGKLFEEIDPPNLVGHNLLTLQKLAKMDWSQIQPEVIGTLFERGLDDSSRAKLGAHYTSAEDILAIVEPVVMWPLRDSFENARDRVTKNPKAASAEVQLLQDKIRSLRLLDPACGSGNFLYIALKCVKDFELELANWAEEFGPRPSLEFNPEQLHGIEANAYAHELASMVIWLGYLQWMHEHGQPFDDEPILRPLENIRHMDALLTLDDEVPDWPEADYIIGNPPFLGGKRMRRELGDEYVDRLFAAYEGQVLRESDLVCYWHERSRQLVAGGRVERVGLLATNSIRGGANQETIRLILRDCNLFAAWSDRPWILDGAAVRCSMLMFDSGQEKRRILDGRSVPMIHPDLTADTANLTMASVLKTNENIAFMGDTKVGPFDIDERTAEGMLAMANPDGRSNSDVIRPWVNGRSIVDRTPPKWVIDFGVDMTEAEAALYVAPFEHLKRVVKPYRAKARSGDRTGVKWWMHQRPRPAMREALAPLTRFVVSPCVSEHRLFTWVQHPTLPDHAVIAFAREDDYFFGILHSKVHELWSLRKGTSLEDRFRYTPTTCFETFPLPKIAPESDKVQEIAAAAADLDRLRNGALAAEPRLSLTKLYNQRPTWLANAHARLDRAVIAAYGWAEGITDEEILSNLLELNLNRASEERSKD